MGSRRRHGRRWSQRRREEQREAARRLSDDRVGEVIFLDRVDGELENDVATRTEIVAAIRRLRPDVVLSHDPWKRYRLHPDHRVTGQLVCDAIVGARDPHFHRDLASPRSARRRCCCSRPTCPTTPRT